MHSYHGIPPKKSPTFGRGPSIHSLHLGTLGHLWHGGQRDDTGGVMDQSRLEMKKGGDFGIPHVTIYIYTYMYYIYIYINYIMYIYIYILLYCCFDLLLVNIQADIILVVSPSCSNDSNAQFLIARSSSDDQLSVDFSLLFGRKISSDSWWNFPKVHQKHEWISHFSPEGLGVKGFIFCSKP